MADDTLFLLLEGYGWLPALRRRAPGEVARTRLLGRRAVAICGPDAARFFYEDDGIRRGPAPPHLVRSTHFVRGTGQNLDGITREARRAMFLPVLHGDAAADLVSRAAAAWDEAVPRWGAEPSVVLFDRVAQVLATAAYGWAGLEPPEHETPKVAADLVAMAEGYATLGPRHWRARAARRRRAAALAHLVRRARAGVVAVRRGTAADAVIRHRDRDGALLNPRVAAFELLNVLRATVAVSWWVTFAAHALHRWPSHRGPLGDNDTGYIEAFVHELRRFYPFAPFFGGRAVRDLSFRGEPIPEGTLVLLDVFGQHHDPALWEEPYVFAPERFAGPRPGPYELIAQGGGDPALGHRCVGEAVTVELLKTLVPRLATLDYRVPGQDLSVSPWRIPARVASGFVMTDVRQAVPAPVPETVPDVRRARG
ncbi:fatty-acid peroxygenase [Thermopolyspora flexuosa]|jgi:fatty-acid peroxygenase|nr:cytochrome P450 [Thermopolyspora flexuosa]GGM79371.1 fatty-acid peroxygenase [Thermopolyspora flexuosa]